MKSKVYDLVEELLTKYPKLRDSDKLLIWNVYGSLNLLRDSALYSNVLIDRNAFMSAPSEETITRCRRKLQELKPELRGSKWTQIKRSDKANQKGTHIYREVL